MLMPTITKKWLVNKSHMIITIQLMAANLAAETVISYQLLNYFFMNSRLVTSALKPKSAPTLDGFWVKIKL